MYLKTNGLSKSLVKISNNIIRVHSEAHTIYIQYPGESDSLCIRYSNSTRGHEQLQQDLEKIEQILTTSRFEDEYV